MLTTHLGLVPRLRMSGTVLPFSLYNIIICLETTLYLFWHIEGRVQLTKNLDQKNFVTIKYSTDVQGKSALPNRSVCVANQHAARVEGTQGRASHIRQS
jgi:hypothetical protein